MGKEEVNLIIKRVMKSRITINLKRVSKIIEDKKAAN